MSKNIAGFVNPAGQAQPSGLVRSLLRFGSVAELRAASPLPKNTQELIDQAVVRVGRQRLVVANDILNAGLIYSLPQWLSVPTLYWEAMGESGTAKRTMVPKARGERQINDRSGSTIPIYCTWDDFSFDIRELAAAERVGAPLDTTHVEQATRNVNESFEDAVINGGATIGGFTTPGLLNAPHANTDTFKDNQAWTHADHSGEDIYDDVQGLIEVANGDKKYGPFNLYVPANYFRKIQGDFKANGDKTTLQRLQEIVTEGRNLIVRGADFMPADTVALVQMTSDVLDLVVGQQPTPVSWEDSAGWERFWVILGCMVPRFKSDYNGNSGIVIGTPS